LEGPSALLVDPLGFDAGDSNLYRYVNNRPVIATDPTGFQQRCILNNQGIGWNKWALTPHLRRLTLKQAANAPNFPLVQKLLTEDLLEDNEKVAQSQLTKKDLLDPRAKEFELRKTEVFQRGNIKWQAGWTLFAHSFEFSIPLDCIVLQTLQLKTTEFAGNVPKNVKQESKIELFRIKNGKSLADYQAFGKFIEVGGNITKIVHEVTGFVGIGHHKTVNLQANQDFIIAEKGPNLTNAVFDGPKVGFKWVSTIYNVEKKLPDFSYTGP
jgi:hypothetical protein